MWHLSSLAIVYILQASVCSLHLKSMLRRTRTFEDISIFSYACFYELYIDNVHFYDFLSWLLLKVELIHSPFISTVPLLCMFACCSLRFLMLKETLRYDSKQECNFSRVTFVSSGISFIHTVIVRPLSSICYKIKKVC